MLTSHMPPYPKQTLGQTFLMLILKLCLHCSQYASTIHMDTFEFILYQLGWVLRAVMP